MKNLNATEEAEVREAMRCMEKVSATLTLLLNDVVDEARAEAAMDASRWSAAAADRLISVALSYLARRTRNRKNKRDD